MVEPEVHKIIILQYIANICHTFYWSQKSD